MISAVNIYKKLFVIIDIMVIIKIPIIHIIPAIANCFLNLDACFIVIDFSLKLLVLTFYSLLNQPSLNLLVKSSHALSDCNFFTSFLS